MGTSTKARAVLAAEVMRNKGARHDLESGLAALVDCEANDDLDGASFLRKAFQEEVERYHEPKEAGYRAMVAQLLDRAVLTIALIRDARASKTD